MYTEIWLGIRDVVILRLKALTDADSEFETNCEIQAMHSLTDSEFETDCDPEIDVLNDADSLNDAELDVKESDSLAEVKLTRVRNRFNSWNNQKLKH